MSEPELSSNPAPESHRAAVPQPSAAGEATSGASAAGGVSPDAAAQTPSKADRCPACGYALAGLARAGTCPECGKAYDTADLYPKPGARDPFACLGKHWSVVAACLLLIPVPMLLILAVPVALFWGVAVLFLTPVYGHSLAKVHLHPYQRSRSAFRNLRRIGGPWLLALAIANMVWGAASSLALFGGLILAGSCLFSGNSFH